MGEAAVRRLSQILCQSKWEAMKATADAAAIAAAAEHKIREADADAAKAAAVHQREVELATVVAREEADAAAARLNHAVQMANSTECAAQAAAAKSEEMAAALATQDAYVEASRAAAAEAMDHSQLIERELEGQRAECAYLKNKLLVEVETRKHLEMEKVLPETAPTSPGSSSAETIADSSIYLATTVESEATIGSDASSPPAKTSSMSLASAVLRQVLESIANSPTVRDEATSRTQGNTCQILATDGPSPSMLDSLAKQLPETGEPTHSIFATSEADATDDEFSCDLQDSLQCLSSPHADHMQQAESTTGSLAAAVIQSMLERIAHRQLAACECQLEKKPFVDGCAA